MRKQPFLILGQHRMTYAGPEDYAVFFPECRIQFGEFARRFLERQAVFDAVAGLFSPAEYGGSFRYEGPVHNPQASVTGRADLEAYIPVPDFPGLPYTADGSIYKVLYFPVRNGNVSVWYVGRVIPVGGNVFQKLFSLIGELLRRRQHLFQQGRRHGVVIESGQGKALSGSQFYGFEIHDSLRRTEIRPDRCHGPAECESRFPDQDFPSVHRYRLRGVHYDFR